MNDEAHMRGPSAETRMDLRETISVEAEQIASMVVDHYRRHGLIFHPGSVDLRVHGSGGSGFGHTRAGFDGATIRLHGASAIKAENAGMPSVLELKPGAVATILIGRLGRALQRAIPAEAIDWEISDAGGSGYGSQPAKLRRAVVTLRIEV